MLAVKPIVLTRTNTRERAADPPRDTGGWREIIASHRRRAERFEVPLRVAAVAGPAEPVSNVLPRA